MDDDEQRDPDRMTDDPPPGVTPAALFGRSVTGLLLGLALGEARALQLIGASPSGPVVRCGVASQLAAFTADSLIRAQSRLDTEGQTDIAPLLWTGLARWAAAQGVAAALTGVYADLAEHRFPDGWLADVPAMRERRGSAPATVRALSGGIPGTPSAPVVTSHGSHGLLRSLPVAAVVALHAPDAVAQLAFKSCALTHGDPLAMHATVATVMCLAHILRTGATLDEALQAAIQLIDGTAPPVVTARFRLVAATRAKSPRSLTRLGGLAPDRSALSVAAAAFYTFGSDVDEDIELVCRWAGDRPAAAALVGSLHGVVSGPESLSPVTVARLEVAWPMEVLGRDLALVLTEFPAGGGGRAALPGWSDRYPAW